MSTQNTEKDKNRWTPKRIAAVAAIIIFAGMALVTLILAFCSFPGSAALFRACAFMTVAVPVLVWLLIGCIGFMTGHHTIASMDLMNSNPDERKKMEDAVKAAQDEASDDSSAAEK